METIDADTISVASHPGYARTGLQHPPQHGLGHWWSTAFASVASQSAYEGARYQVYAAAAPDVHGGDFYGPAQILLGDVELTNVVGQGRNLNAAARLWSVSEDLTGVHFDLPTRAVSTPIAVPA
ncbi:MAG TPA: hypothetical protein PKD09_07925 [Aggregatilinea sp.]|uniref:hypothetical protein n=1 Tax=Aggregatilinea sp. TaxID=2806333 RepID=UPI002C489263|nr:hypothetical protein [Aggregatilinea sp.]HML21558.1 hypothetical protein [Aggregatilinea sp.]